MTSGSNVGMIYGLEFQCRSLCSVAADTEDVSFLVGTQGLKLPNQVHHVQLREDTQTLAKTVYQHPLGEVWQIASSHSDPSVLCTRHSQVDGGNSGALKVGGTVWRMSQDKSTDRYLTGVGQDLELVCHLKADQAANDEVEHISWLPQPDSSKVMVLAANKLILFDISVTNGSDEDRCASVVSSGQLEGKHGHDRLSCGTWNPHQNCQQFATANEHQVRGWDVRTMTQTWNLESPSHCGLIRCLDFNPNKQYMLATTGDDGGIRFWDIRAPKVPVQIRSDHSHWVWSVKFNQCHDQLLLTSSSDGRVVLSCMASISSESRSNGDDDDDDDDAVRKPPLEDGVIQVYEDHEDSVYVCDWSPADPWTFASLSFDGRLVINQVPKRVKNRILNL